VAERVAIPAGESDILIENMDEIALAYVVEKALGIPPATGDGARAAGVQVDGMGHGIGDGWPALVGDIAGILGEVITCDSKGRLRGRRALRMSGGLMTRGQSGRGTGKIGMLINADRALRAGPVGIGEADLQIVTAEEGGVRLAAGCGDEQAERKYGE